MSDCDSNPKMATLEGQLGASLNSLGLRIMRMPFTLFVAVLVIIALLRIGPLGIGPGFIDLVRESADAFPKPANYLSSGVGATLLGIALDPVPNVEWWAAGLAAWTAVMAILVSLSIRAGEWRRVVLLLVAMSPAFALSVSMIGQTDIFLYAGSLLIAAGRSYKSLVLGVVLAPLGNPEQAVASAVLLLATALILRYRAFLVRAWIYAVVTITYLLLVQLWMWRNEIDGHRLDLVLGTDNVIQGAMTFALGTLPLSLYAAYGSLWVVVIVALSQWSKRQMLMLTLPLFFLPLGLQFITYDGTRDFVVPSLASAILLLRRTWNTHWSLSAPPPKLVGALALLLLFTPALIVDTGGAIRMPYADWLSHIRIFLS